MARWALVRGGACVTVVVQDTLPTVVDLGGEWVAAADNAGPGWLWNGSAWSAPPVVGRRSIPPKDFWRRFTAAEREVLQNKVATGTQGVKDKLNAFRDYVQTGGNVELDDDYIIAAVAQMESAGVLAAGRAATILTIA